MTSLRHENVTIIIHSQPCNPCPENLHYFSHAKKNPNNVTETIHIKRLSGEYITIEQIHDYKEWLAKK